MAGKQSKQAALRGLRSAGRRLWDAVTTDFELDEHERGLLLQTAQTADIIADLQAVGRYGTHSRDTELPRRLKRPSAPAHTPALSEQNLRADLLRASGDLGGGMMAKIPSWTRFIVCAAGDIDVVLARHRSENRMVPLLTFTAADGTHYTVELSTPDVIALHESLKIMFDADQAEVSSWWRQLTARDPSGTSTPAAENGSALMQGGGA